MKGSKKRIRFRLKGSKKRIRFRLKGSKNRFDRTKEMFILSKKTLDHSKQRLKDSIELMFILSKRRINLLKQRLKDSAEMFIKSSSPRHKVERNATTTLENEGGKRTRDFLGFKRHQHKRGSASDRCNII